MPPSEPAPIQLRPKQVDILTYTHGRMGISAVPGSGKTFTLSLLAANLLSRNVLEEDQELLIVTLVNSAVDNFYQRVSGFVADRGLIPNIGYRVRTLHGLANDIVRERPDLSGLEDNFQIIDEKEADEIRNDVAQAWLHNHPGALDGYLDADLTDERLDEVQHKHLPNLVKDIALSVIRYAKDRQQTPELLQARLEALPFPLPLAAMGSEIYSSYQRALAYRGAVDFDDLIRLALHTLESDGSLLARLRHQWPYILEDEAQDSSALQEDILRLLSGTDGNWVRVGDPNQAIYETFTTANPEFLRNFLQEPGVQQRDLPNSGRSTLGIIHLANQYVEWTQSEHPLPAARDALQAPPFIEPTGPDDPKPNPPDDQTVIRLITRRYTPSDEVNAIVDSIARWLPDHPADTVAVLTPRNQRAFDLVDELRKRSIPYMDDFLRSSSSTRTSAGSLAHILRFMADPQSASRLAQVYQVWRRDDREDVSLKPRLERITELLRSITRIEDYVWPSLEKDWLETSDLAQSDPEAYDQLRQFRVFLQRWQGSIILPADQMILLLAQDILTAPTELAIAHKLALLMRQTIGSHPDWRLPQLANELVAIAKNERRFLGFNDTDTGFEPDKHPGKVIVSTLHKAKGLEWDRVYLMSVNNYDFPSGTSQDRYISEKWFIQGKLNLEAEALAQLRSVIAGPAASTPVLGEATLQARLDYVRERVRLLYVGITRARKNLILTWNSGRKSEMSPAVPLIALSNLLEEQEDTA